MSASGPRSASRGAPPPCAASPYADPPLSMPGMIMIGAASRDAGKTVLATRLVERFRGRYDVAGAKITAVHGEGVACPRGKEGCGVCSSLDGPYRITEETGELEGKDTTRLIEAGASPVLWLCCREAHLEEGARDLRARLGPDALVVCESNSLRRVLEPGLFVIVRRAGKKGVKRSCREVMDLADATIAFDGERHHPDVSAFGIVDGRWTIDPGP